LDIAGCRLLTGMTYQLAKDQQVDPGRSKLGAVGMAQPVRPDPRLLGTAGVPPEQRSQPRLRQRCSRGRAEQHQEALRGGQAGRASSRR
jgi:hypothetical protein